MEAYQQIQSISTRDEFIAFVHKLSEEFEADPSSWENDTLPLFLKALASWVEDMDGYFLNKKMTIPEQPSWNLLANIMMAATMYE